MDPDMKKDKPELDTHHLKQVIKAITGEIGG